MPTIVGIFDDQEAAEEAVNALDALDLEEGSIHVISRAEVRRGGVLGGLARGLSGGDSPVEDALRRLHVDRDAAAFYEEELGAEGILVAAEVDGDMADRARSAMRGAGGTVKN